MPISPRRELLHASDVLVLSGALVFAAATQGTCLDRSFTSGLFKVCIKEKMVDRNFKTKKPMGQVSGKKSNPND